MSSLPVVELCSLLTLTSWESTQIHLLGWSPNALLEEQSTFSLWGWQWIQQMGIPPGNANKGDIQQEALEDVEFQFDELDCLRGPGPVSTLQLRCGGSHWDILSLSHSGGQYFIHVAKGNGRGDAPGQKLDWVSYACLREDLLESSMSLFSHLGSSCLMLLGQPDLPIIVLPTQPLYLMD